MSSYTVSVHGAVPADLTRKISDAHALAVKAHAAALRKAQPSASPKSVPPP